MLPKPGEPIRVEWVDIMADDGGDPDKADLHVWYTFGLYHKHATRKKTRVLIMRGSCAATKSECDKQSGYTCIPLACIREIRRLTVGRVLDHAESV